MEGLIQEEISELLQKLGEERGEIMVKRRFNISVVNALWTIISGKRFSLDDPKLNDIVSRLDKLNEASTKDLVFLFPPIRHVLPDVSGFKRQIQVIYDAISFLQPTIEEHIEKHDPSVEANDFIDVYLNKMKDTENDPKSSFSGNMGRWNLEACLLDMLMAGSDTTSTGLTWASLYMINYPRIQDKVHEEIDQVLGTSRLPRLEDRPNMPYTEATLQEVLRMGTIAPLGIPHATNREIKIGKKYVIPAGYTVFPNLRGILHNPRYFDNPSEFRPERFLDEGGRFSKTKSERNIPFSLGNFTLVRSKLCELKLTAACIPHREARLPRQDLGPEPAVLVLRLSPAAVQDQPR